MVKQGRCVFILVSINIVFMMITDSVFSALSPYLWLGDVWSTSDTLIQLYSASQTLFYIANTFFACLVIWVLYHFGSNSRHKGLTTLVTKGSGDESVDNNESLMASTARNQRRRSRYLILDSVPGNSSDLDMSMGTALMKSRKHSEIESHGETFDYYQQ